MKTRYRVGLGGTMLDSISDAICIQDVRYSEIEINKTVDAPGNRDGGIVTKRYRQKASVEIEFSLNLYDTVKRTAIMDKIKTWAKNGGKLVTNDRPDQALYDCECDKFPEISSVKKWTEPITMVFSAYKVPYWQDIEPTAASVSGTNASGKIKIPGNASKAYVSVDVIPTAAAITWFSVTVGSTTIRIDAQIAKNSLVTIDYDDHMNIRIKNGSTSLLNKRSAGSSDSLVGTCGTSNKIQIKASAKTGATFYARGAWL